jgi:hypothetical protein
MVFLDAATGLRRSELFALKWGDVEFDNLQIVVQRSIYRSIVGNCKTEASKKPVPMDPILAAELWAWKQHSSYNQPYDWVFASPRTKGKNPYWPDIIPIPHRPACRNASRNSKACRLAHVPAQLFHDIDRKRRKREGGTRANAALELPQHSGNLFSGSNSGKAGRSTSGNSDDRPLEGRGNRSKSIETPIERFFCRTLKRSMTRTERGWLHLKPAPIVRLCPKSLRWDIRWHAKSVPLETTQNVARSQATAQCKVGLCLLFLLCQLPSSVLPSNYDTGARDERPSNLRQTIPFMESSVLDLLAQIFYR